MLLELTISQLDTGPMSSDRAAEMGQLGYMQWLDSLSCNSDYRQQALYAYERALPFAANSPAIASFCALLDLSLQSPLEPLPLKLPNKQRRGGARARRLTH